MDCRHLESTFQYCQRNEDYAHIGGPDRNVLVCSISLSILHVASLELVIRRKVNVPINLSGISKNSEDNGGDLKREPMGSQSIGLVPANKIKP